MRMTARFQVRKQASGWEVTVLAPGARAWELVVSHTTFRVAMLLATGQVPYGDWPGWQRWLTLRWVSA